ncbi:glycosyltransferase [Shewanella waksmanii]|uniref:glycosyltransferase family A protein n=1 Tax=Shewanella waksmanii TaxID=213783 RepID=UPI003735E72E
MILDVLISTYGDRLAESIKVLMPESANVRYKIIHQCTSSKDYTAEIESLLDRKDVQYHRLYNRGLSKSRNKAITVSDGDISLIMDDDVALVEDFYSIVCDAFSQNPSADMISFQISEQESGELIKNYPSNAKKHNKQSILRIGSIEMVVRTHVLKQACFPEYLGAGSALPACEEPVYLSRLLERGAKLFYRPLVIAHHPKLSSGKVFDSEATLACRGVAFREIYGLILGFLAVNYFYIKNRNKFSLQGTSAYRAILKGFLMSKTQLEGRI